MVKRSRRLLSRDHQAEYLLTWSYDNKNVEMSPGLECHFGPLKPVYGIINVIAYNLFIKVKGFFTKL